MTLIRISCRFLRTKCAITAVWLPACTPACPLSACLHSRPHLCRARSGEEGFVAGAGTLAVGIQEAIEAAQDRAARRPAAARRRRAGGSACEYRACERALVCIVRACVRACVRLLARICARSRPGPPVNRPLRLGSRAGRPHPRAPGNTLQVRAGTARVCVCARACMCACSRALAHTSGPGPHRSCRLLRPRNRKAAGPTAGGPGRPAAV